MLQALRAQLPARHAIAFDTWTLLYSTREHGVSIRTLYRRIHKVAPTIWIVKTSTGHVLGGYSPEGLAPQYGYQGTGEAFVFAWRSPIVRPRHLFAPVAVPGGRQLSVGDLVGLALSKGCAADDATMAAAGGTIDVPTSPKSQSTKRCDGSCHNPAHPGASAPCCDNPATCECECECTARGGDGTAASPLGAVASAISVFVSSPTGPPPYEEAVAASRQGSAAPTDGQRAASPGPRGAPAERARSAPRASAPVPPPTQLKACTRTPGAVYSAYFCSASADLDVYRWSHATHQAKEQAKLREMQKQLRPAGPAARTASSRPPPRGALPLSLASVSARPKDTAAPTPKPEDPHAHGVPESNEYFVLATQDSISFGGGRGGGTALHIGGDLTDGHTAPCVTYDSPPLIDPDAPPAPPGMPAPKLRYRDAGCAAAAGARLVQFSIVSLEVWHVGFEGPPKSGLDSTDSNTVAVGLLSPLFVGPAGKHSAMVMPTDAQLRAARGEAVEEEPAPVAADDTGGPLSPPAHAFCERCRCCVGWDGGLSGHRWHEHHAEGCVRVRQRRMHVQ